jgi:hypothetical protein
MVQKMSNGLTPSIRSLTGMKKNCRVPALLEIHDSIDNESCELA